MGAGPSKRFPVEGFGFLRLVCVLMRKRSFLFALLASLALVGPHVAGSHACDPGGSTDAKVSPMLYGLMTEEINYSYDGGIYGELVRDRVIGRGFGGCRTGRWSRGEIDGERVDR